jgi:hypothetical protein
MSIFGSAVDVQKAKVPAESEPKTAARLFGQNHAT